MFLLPEGTFPYREERQIGDTYNWIGLLCINDNNIVNVIKGNLVIKKRVSFNKAAGRIQI